LVEDERFIFEKKKIRRASTKNADRERERERNSHLLEAALKNPN
jgi:hypothetical protein